jgi:hypothetical protein
MEKLDKLGMPIPDKEKAVYILEEGDLIIKPPSRAYKGVLAPEHAETAIRAGETFLFYGRSAPQILPEYITRTLSREGRYLGYTEEDFLPDDDPRIGERRWIVVVHAESFKAANESMSNLRAYIVDRVDKIRRRRPFDDWGEYTDDRLDTESIIRRLYSGEFYFLES